MRGCLDPCWRQQQRQVGTRRETCGRHRHGCGQEWIAAALKEIRALEEKGTWKEVDISEAQTKILPGTWVGRVKRRPDGSILKRKMRYAVRGDLDTRENLETHSHVAAWSSITGRILV